MACIVYSLCEDFPASLSKHKERLPDHLLLMTLFFPLLMQKLNVCAGWTPLSVCCVFNCVAEETLHFSFLSRCTRVSLCWHFLGPYLQWQIFSLTAAISNLGVPKKNLQCWKTGKSQKRQNGIYQGCKHRLLYKDAFRQDAGQLETESSSQILFYQSCFLELLSLWTDLISKFTFGLFFFSSFLTL